jgi:hypothetical protein
MTQHISAESIFNQRTSQSDMCVLLYRVDGIGVNMGVLRRDRRFVRENGKFDFEGLQFSGTKFEMVKVKEHLGT